MKARREQALAPQVVVEPGEADSIEGCMSILGRVSRRIDAATKLANKLDARALTPDERDWLADVYDELRALTALRGAVRARKVTLHNLADLANGTPICAAVVERFGHEVMRELEARGMEIREARRVRHAAALVGSVVAVGAVGGPRRRKASPALGS